MALALQAIARLGKCVTGFAAHTPSIQVAGCIYSQVLQSLFYLVHDGNEGRVHVAQQGQRLGCQDAGVTVGGARAHQQARLDLQQHKINRG